ncbi:phage tail tape measure protein [Hymenobacter sp. IS2118]|uniref:phage tail tape measure protein n=1 Tax=Hymenobacter sp. IS2118 TaxID=1505605 RepID=UPI00055287E5|nr:phage tail tape measure protein [Hymenobacter sp. IS2118]
MSNDKEAAFIMKLVDLVSGPLKGVADITGTTTKKLNELTGAANHAGKVGGGAFTGLKGGLAGVKSGLMAAASEVPGLNQVIGLVSNPYVAIATSIGAVVAVAGKATGMAMDFEKGMAQINTTARLGRPELDALRNQLLTMGAGSTVPLQEIPAAYNQIISAVGDSKKALDIFGPALQASQAGFTDIRTIADSVTNVLGAVGKATPTEALDTMFAAVRLGKGEFKDFAQYLPKIIPLANNAGIKYQEVAGAFALMTGKGQKAEQAAMLLENAMTALSKTDVIYGSKSVKGFERSGIAIFDQQHKMRTLVDIVGDLSKKTTGLNDQQRQAFLAGLGLDTQAAASFSILAQNAGQLKEFVGGTTNSAGEMAEAYQRSLSPADKLTLYQQQYRKIMTDIGYKLLPYANKALEMGLGWVEKIKNNSELIGNYFKAWAAPVRLAWSAVKGVYNVLDSISGLTGGSTGSLMQALFGDAGDFMPSLKSFLNDLYRGIDVLLSAIDDASEGHFKQAAQRFTDFRSQLRAEASEKSYDAGKGQDFAKMMGFGYVAAAPYLLPFGAGGGAGKKNSPPPQSPLAGLNARNKGTNLEGDNSKARIVNLRIDKIEVNPKVYGATAQNMKDIGNQVAAVIVGATRDAEIILSNGN